MKLNDKIMLARSNWYTIKNNTQVYQYSCLELIKDSTSIEKHLRFIVFTGRYKLSPYIYIASHSIPSLLLSHISYNSLYLCFFSLTFRAHCFQRFLCVSICKIAIELPIHPSSIFIFHFLVTPLTKSPKNQKKIWRI